MDELMQKLQSVLSDEESMNQLRQLASAFGGGNGDNSSSTQQPPASSQNNVTDNTPSINMDDISKLLASIATDNSQPNSNPQQQQSQNSQPDILNMLNQNQQSSDQLPFDIGKMMTLGNIISNASKADKNTELLLALKPHLKEEKQDKVDKVIKIFKLISIWPAIKDSGLLGGDLFGIL